MHAAYSQRFLLLLFRVKHCEPNCQQRSLIFVRSTEMFSVSCDLPRCDLIDCQYLSRGLPANSTAWLLEVAWRPWKMRGCTGDLCATGARQNLSVACATSCMPNGKLVMRPGWQDGAKHLCRGIHQLMTWRSAGPQGRTRGWRPRLTSTTMDRSQLLWQAAEHCAGS